jgi:20S proteasome subunit alpha 5
MFLTRSEYDRGVNTFSPEGRLFQVEYAIEAIKLGSTAIGIKTAEGVMLCVEKRITSPLMEPDRYFSLFYLQDADQKSPHITIPISAMFFPLSIVKIVEIDRHVGAAMSGLTADARTMIDHARVEAQVCEHLLWQWRFLIAVLLRVCRTYQHLKRYGAALAFHIY